MGRRHLTMAVASVILAVVIVGPSAEASKPLPAPIELSATLSRTSAAAYQVIEVSGSSCVRDAHPVEAQLYEGADADLATQYAVADSTGEASADGTFVVRLGLWTVAGSHIGVALPAGQYTFVVWCSDGSRYVQSATQVVTVAGSMPGDQITSARQHPGRTFTVSGGACTQGEVHLRFRAAGNEFPDDDFAATAVVQPAADGSWTYDLVEETPYEIYGELYAYAECGDAAADGFLYEVQRAAYLDNGPTDPVVDHGSTSTTTTTDAVGPGTDGSSGAAPARPIPATAGYTG